MSTTQKGPCPVWFLAGFLAGFGCSSGPIPGPDPSQVVLDAIALDPTHIRIEFQIENRLDPTTAGNPANYEIANYLVEPPASLEVTAVDVEERAVVLTTSIQEALAIYTVRVKGIQDETGALVADEATTNVVGVGDVPRAPVTFRVDSTLHVPLVSPTLLVTVNPDTGVFSSQLRSIPLTDPDQDGIFEATLEVAVDPRRTVDPLDDRLGPDRVSYAARVQSNALPASELTFFEVLSLKPVTVPIELTTPLQNGGGGNENCSNGVDDNEDGAVDCQDPDCSQEPQCQVINEDPLLPPPIDPIPGDGVTLVRIAVDDRAARELSRPGNIPRIKISVDGQGFFDPDIARIEDLQPSNISGIFFVDVNVRPDPNRVIGGNTETTFPFVTFLRVGNEDFEGITKAFVVPDETPRTVNLSVGNPNLVPVTFRVDVSQAFLNPQGTERGVRPGEAVFLTGEFPLAEDAFGRNASDVFSGGENILLEMRERVDAPGVWERTIFLPGNRPFGWKVVRCPAGVGCGQLNQFVASSGRAFATVMKNLVTENTDVSAGSSTSVIINPKNLAEVVYKDGSVHDYTNARVHDGLRGEPTPPAPNESIMFKQEVPDLVVVVGEEPVKTPIFIVGTWRDVNLPFTPEEIIQNGEIVNLTDFDYDDGFIGFFPPVRPDDLVDPNTPEDCVNGSDDNSNGLIDCEDPECSIDPACISPAEVCNNGSDDDNDGAVDCADSDCAAFPSCQVPEICDNGLDDNGNGNIDCADTACNGQIVGENGEICEIIELTCDDGFDNDGDGNTDCADTTCASNPICQVPEICDNGLDDNGNGLADCADAECVGGPECVVAFCPPVDPGTAPTLSFSMDGALDSNATVLFDGVSINRMQLAVAFSGDGKLYVATNDAGEGSDHFLFVSATPPGDRIFAAPFAKAGDVVIGSGDMLFLADEQQNDFSGWFLFGAGGPDVLLNENVFLSASGSGQGVLEGILPLTDAFGFLPQELFLSAAPYDDLGGTDGGGMFGIAQIPPGNDDGNIDGDEFLHICLPGLEIVQ